jgi:hypothetical protein
MAAAITFTQAVGRLDSTQSTAIVRGSVALTGSYTLGGDTLSFTSSKSPVLSAGAPLNVLFTENPSATITPSGYNLYYQTGTTPANGKIRITSAAGTELSAGAYPAALLQANISFMAYFKLGQ